MKYLSGVTTLRLIEDRCTGCGMCTVVCPHGVWEMRNRKAVIVDRDACMECSACATNCPAEAVTVQAGVGCAQAVINSALGRSSSTCCSLEDYETCDTACESVDRKQGSSGCC